MRLSRIRFKLSAELANIHSQIKAVAKLAKSTVRKSQASNATK